MTTVDIETLIPNMTEDEFFELGLEVARALELDVDSWRTGDPTRSDYKFLAEALAKKDPIIGEYVKSAFLSKAEGEWLKIVALESYGIEVPDATFAEPTVTVTNDALTGGYYPLAAGDLIFKCTATGKTFHSTSGPIVAGVEVAALDIGQTATFTLVADEAGSDSTVGTDEIDELVTTLIGVGVDSSTPGVGSDEMTPAQIRDLCNATLGALSPNGPADAYEYVCTNSELTGVTEITGAHTVDDSVTGDVQVYVRSAGGTVSGPSVTAAQAAVSRWAQPLCITAVVSSASALTVAVTCTISGDDIPADFETRITAALAAFFAALEIGATVYRSALIAAIHAAIPEIDSVVMTLPAADATPAEDEVAVSGAVTVTEI